MPSARSRLTSLWYWHFFYFLQHDPVCHVGRLCWSDSIGRDLSQGKRDCLIRWKSSRRYCRSIDRPVATRRASADARRDYTTCAVTSFDEAVKSSGGFHICEGAPVLELFTRVR